MERAVTIEARIQGLARRVELRPESGGYRGRIGDRPVEAEVRHTGEGALTIRWGGRTFDVTYSRDDRQWRLDLGSRQVTVEIQDPLRSPQETPSPGFAGEGRQEVRSAMPGRVVRVKVKPGETVDRGQGLLVVEAMKMENEVPSPKSGTVRSVAVVPGQTVEMGAVLVVVE